ncbi:MAG TPA: hypothetical protein VFE62_05665 [Gemmataceae bacterium]|nr:hypothetical protein [Gemmataceae bacterium]
MTKVYRNGLLAAVGLGLALVSGCQSWPMDVGMTLPSPYYLRHAPQYTPQSPPYPLVKELNSLEQANRKVAEENQP